MNATYSILPATLAATLGLAIPALSQDTKEQPVQPAPDAGEVTVTGDVADTAAEQTYLGVGTTSVPGFLSKHLHLRAATGLLVKSVDAEGPAGKAGFTVDDIITKVDGNAVASQQELADLVHARKAGDQMELDYIHDGTSGKRTVQLGSHKAEPQAAGEVEVGEAQLIPDIANLNGNLPPEAQKLMRQAMERARKNIGQQMNFQVVPGGAGRIQIIPGGGGIQILPGAGGVAGGMGGLQIQGNATVNSSVHVSDGEGSIEMKTADGGSEVRVLDKAGKEVWSGPWDTAQDKAAAPADIRQRIEHLNMAPQGFKLQMPPQPLPDKAEVELQIEEQPKEPKAKAPKAVPPSDDKADH